MCEKLQAAAVNPGSMNADVIDYAHSNPSLSSDDTLATSTASPILDENNTASNSSREEVAESALLIGGYESTDGESEDELNSTTLLGD